MHVSPCSSKSKSSKIAGIAQHQVSCVMSKLSSIATCYLQIEEDTDRDRYMSPLEAKNYGLIDEVIGGDEAGFQISGTTRDFPKTKESYVNWVRPCTLSFMLII